jgi:hypothetical protein
LVIRDWIQLRHLPANARSLERPNYQLPAYQAPDLRAELRNIMDIDLKIEKLILEGFEPADRERMVAAIKQELFRLLAGRELPQSLAQRGSLAQLDGGQFQMAAGAPVETVGVQVAQQIYAGLAGKG